MDIDLDDAVAMDMTIEDGLGEEVDKFLLHESLDRTGTVCRLIALRAHVVLEVGSEFQCDTILRELLLKITHLHLENLTDIGLGERLKHDHLIDSVEELRTDCALEDIEDLVAALLQQNVSLRFLDSACGLARNDRRRVL